MIAKRTESIAATKKPEEFKAFKTGLSQSFSGEQMKAFMAYLREKFNVEINENILATLEMTNSKFWE
jgi:hypothetical protein